MCSYSLHLTIPLLGLGPIDILENDICAVCIRKRLKTNIHEERPRWMNKLLNIFK